MWTNGLHCRRSGQRAFTLVELLVVVSIIALLIAILLPSLKRAREQAKDAMDRSNLHQLGLAVNFYSNEWADYLPWMPGSPITNPPPPPGTPQYAKLNRAPYHQYYQIITLFKYMRNAKIFQCPQAKGGEINPPHRSNVGPRSVLGYKNANETGNPSQYQLDSFYRVKRADSAFRPIRDQYFPTISLTAEGEYVNELYTEYWFNDWSQGALSGSWPIPPVNGGLINKIPFPSITVMMCDALHWNPRHHGGNHFLFSDAHVDWFKSENYFDVEGWEPGERKYENALDKDKFGNRPYWSWGIGRPGFPVNGDTGQR